MWLSTTPQGPVSVGLVALGLCFQLWDLARGVFLVGKWLLQGFASCWSACLPLSLCLSLGGGLINVGGLISMPGVFSLWKCQDCLVTKLVAAESLPQLYAGVRSCGTVVCVLRIAHQLAGFEGICIFGDLLACMMLLSYSGAVQSGDIQADWCMCVLQLVDSVHGTHKQSIIPLVCWSNPYTDQHQRLGKVGSTAQSNCGIAPAPCYSRMADGAHCCCINHGWAKLA